MGKKCVVNNNNKFSKVQIDLIVLIKSTAALTEWRKREKRKENEKKKRKNNPEATTEQVKI